MPTFELNLPTPAWGILNNRAIRDWFFVALYKGRRWPLHHLFFWEEINCTGYGPFEIDDLNELVSELTPSDVPDPMFSLSRNWITRPCDVLVIGREGWDKACIDYLIDCQVGSEMFIYSQEMLLAFLATQRCPLTESSSEVLAAFKAGHPGLEYVAEGWPNWVSTIVAQDWRTAPMQTVNLAARPKEGPLHVLGYGVGKTGKLPHARHRILREAFTGVLPLVGSPEYMEDWGEPNSAKRLRKIANSIATFCRNMKAKANASPEAIEDWESDLEWLRNEFYHGHMRFQWPNTRV